MPLSNEEKKEVMDIFRECVQEMKENGESTKADLAVSRGFAVRGWYGDTDPNSFVIPNQVDDATALNNESAGFYELNAVAGAGHSPAAWGVPYSDYTSAGIYYEMENS